MRVPTFSPSLREVSSCHAYRNEDAERDCDAVLRLDGKNVKGFFRRGQARVALQKLKEAEAGAYPIHAVASRAEFSVVFQTLKLR